jgi:hypothetical protein
VPHALPPPPCSTPPPLESALVVLLKQAFRLRRVGVGGGAEGARGAAVAQALLHNGVGGVQRGQALLHAEDGVRVVHAQLHAWGSKGGWGLGVRKVEGCFK